MNAPPAESLPLILTAVGLTTFLCGALMLALGMLWMRHAKRSMERFQDSLLESLVHPNRPPGPTGSSELVARFRVSDGGKTVSILQRGGRRFLEVDGELTTAERDSLERYLRNEGFIE